jgi:hypothetical protein
LKNDAEEAERKIDDVCRDLWAGLLQRLPAGIARHWELLFEMDPRDRYASAVLQRFCVEPPFGDTLLGLADRLKADVLMGKTSLPLANPAARQRRLPLFPHRPAKWLLVWQPGRIFSTIPNCRRW